MQDNLGKRILCGLLACVLVLGYFPAPAQAETTAFSNDATLEGDSSFGDLLTNTVNEAQEQQPQVTYDGRVCDMVIDGTIATVEYTTPVDANLVVAIYTEDGQKLLGSGLAAVSPEETIATVEIEIATMPYYFKAGAYLLDAQTNDPVSEEFETDHYTKVMQDILAATVDDFNPDLVLNLDNDRTTNFAVFNENTLIASSGDAQNQITDNGNGTFTVTNADDRFLAMQPGDTFAYTYPDGTVLIVNAASVTIEGNTVTITNNPEADLSTVFDFVKIEEDSYDKDYTYDDSTLAEGLTVISDEEFAAGQEEPQAAAFGLGVDVDKKGSIGTNFSISHRKAGNDENNATINGKVAFGLTVNLRIYLSLSYQYVAFSCDYSLSGKVDITGKLTMCQLPMGDYNIYICPGVDVHVNPKFVVEASGSLSFTIEWKGSLGQAYDSDLGRWTDIGSPPSVKSKVEFSGKLFIGVKAKLGIAAVHEKVLDLSAEGTVGFEVSAADTAQGLSTPSGSEIHTCAVCFEGEVDKVASLALEIQIFGDFWKDKWTIAEFKIKESDIYFSFDNGDWGFTKCPYKAFKTTITVKSNSQDPVKDVPIKLYQDGAELQEVLLLDDDKQPYVAGVPETDENGVTTVFLPSGSYSCQFVCNGKEYKKDFTIVRTTKTLNVVLDAAQPGTGDIVDSGTCGANVTWTLDSNGLLTISGSGAMKDYTSPWYNNHDQIKSVTIEQGVTSIGAYAFSGCSSLTSVTIPDSVTPIGESAFANCSSLTSVTIPNSVTSIGYSAFDGCSSLKDVYYGGTEEQWSKIFISAGNDPLKNATLHCNSVGSGEIIASGPCGANGDNVTYVLADDGTLTISGSGAMKDYKFSETPWYNNRDQIKSVTIEQGVTSIGDCAFDYCSSLTSVTILDGVTSIGSRAFDSCSSLTSVTIPNSVTSIGNQAFDDCSSLTSVTIPNSVTDIGAYAFRGCGSLTSVTIPDGVTSIETGTFDGCINLTSVTIPNSVTSIGDGAFGYCSNLTSVTIPDSVTSIGDRAFSYCSSLSSVTIPDGVTSIGAGAFFGCRSLTSVTIPDSVTSLGTDVFRDCNCLTDINVDPNNEYWCSVDGVLFSKDMKTLVACPGGKAGAYKCPDGVTSIRYNAFFGCSSLSSVTIPDSVTSIGYAAFYRCSSLTSVTIPNSVTSISDYAFQYCSNLKSVTIPDSVTSIGDWAFWACSSLSSVTIPDSVTSIGDRAFSYCSSLSSVTISNSVTSIGIQAFSYCSSLTSVTIPVSVASIGDSAFAGCTKLTDVHYGGTKAQWEQIDTGNTGVDATIHCTDGIYGIETLLTEDVPEVVSDAPAPEPEEPEETPDPEPPAPEPEEPEETPDPEPPAPEPEEPENTPDPEPPVPEPEEPENTPDPEPPAPEPEEPENTPDPATPDPESEETPEAGDGSLILEEVSHIQWYTAPAGAKMTEVPVLQRLSAFSGTESAKSGVRSVKFTGLEPGEKYALVVSLIPGNLEPANLQYIDQNNANPDGTLAFTYIPRQEVAAHVTLYGIPAGRTVTLDREYLALEMGAAPQKLTASVAPEEWAGDLRWSAENPEDEEVICVDSHGEVTAIAPGTAYAVATVTHGKYTFSGRCRVDVTEKQLQQEVIGVQLGTTAVTTELFRTDYAAIDLILQLTQNQSAFATFSARAMPARVEDTGAAISSAEFTDENTAAAFDLAVKDDRTLLVIPKQNSVDNPKTVAGRYKSQIRVKVDGKEFTTEAALTLTVKKSTPRLKVSAMTFNPFYTGQTQSIPITGATVTEILRNTNKDTGKSSALPTWLNLEGGLLTLQEDAPAKASGRVYLKVYTAEWAIPTEVTVAVKTAYAAPRLKLSASSAVFAAGEAYTESRGIALKLLCSNKKQTLQSLNVTDIAAPEGFEIQNFDPVDGSFILKPTEAVTAGTKGITVFFSDTLQTVTLKFKVSIASVRIAAKPSTVTLNSVVGDSAAIALTASPADYQIRGVNFRLTDSRGNPVEQDLLAYRYENGFVMVETVKGKTQPNTTYRLYVSTKDTAKETVITVKTLADNPRYRPSVSAKVTGRIDLSLPGICAVVTPVFKNYTSGTVEDVDWNITEFKGRTLLGDATSKFNFTQIPEKNQLQLSAGEGLVPGNTYLLSLTYRLVDNSSYTCTAKITVMRTAVRLRLSKTGISLNRAIEDSAAVSVTCLTKGYDFQQPKIKLILPSSKDGNEIDLSKPSDQEPLGIEWSAGKLIVTANSGAEAGKTYKVVLRATESDPAVTLTVRIPTNMTVSASLRARGFVDMVRDGTSVTITPTYRNYAGLTDIEPKLTIESWSGKRGEPYQPVPEGQFTVTANTNRTFTITKTPGAQLNPNLKYRAKLAFQGGNPAYVNFTVKSGTARVAVSNSVVLYRADRFSRRTFRLTTADKTLNPIVSAEIKETRLHEKELFEIYSYGNGEFAIGFANDVVPTGKLPTSVVLYVYTADGPFAKSVASVTLRLQIR